MAAQSQSVQSRARGDAYGFEFPAGPVNPWTFFTIQLAGQQQDGIPPWSYYPAYRDACLRIISKREPIMAGAIYSITSRIKSLPWSIKGGKINKAYYQNLFAEADGGFGFGQFISKVITDLLTQDNGAFIEVVGPGKSDKPLVGRPTEIWHLDSAQCWRTFDPEFPVIYIDPMDNTYHKMHKTRVIVLSSNPQPDVRARNVGFCGVSRALKLLQIIRNIEIYKDEKISGRFKRAIIYGNGVTQKQWDQAFEESDEQTKNKNYAVYNEIPVLLSMLPNMNLKMLDLAQLPDGFDYEKEVTLYVYIVALCMGTDAREFWPATTSGATKADATVQHLKAQGKGIADIIVSLETAFNWHIMPGDGSASFDYDFTDDEQDKAQAEIHQLKAANIETYQRNGWITPQQGYQMAVYEGLIDPKAFDPSAYPENADSDSPLFVGEMPAINPSIPNEPSPSPPINSTNTSQRSIAFGAKASETMEDYLKGLRKYQDELERILEDMQAGIKDIPDLPESLIDDLLQEAEVRFNELMPRHLTDAFGMGLAGEDPTDDGIDNLKEVGKKSKGYFKDSLLDSLRETFLTIAASDHPAGNFNFGEGIESYRSRFRSYGGAWWNALWVGVGDNLVQAETQLQVRRILDDGATHCDTCPGKAKTYDSFEQMVSEAGIPGDGSDTCLGNCRCHVEVQSAGKDGGFGILVGKPTVFVQPLFEVI